MLMSALHPTHIFFAFYLSGAQVPKAHTLKEKAKNPQIKRNSYFEWLFFKDYFKLTY